ncbi:MAG: nicotinate-nucleotide--dimethylbenzimidazole phosphoribosyltransferase [Tateyamaria sp.]|nr:nicotinate-nucleotide--dimethylbenzimidazole phosphoribosyltransferase [Tateyamaria sp.]MDG0983200.1 nicotinate-nucleotide--dimethylbenzimidazole phosphoribosyltransferase [Tateyamaria sp.]MDG1420007.1 nicotinate-nucleotide--dimethylbenzimidazole phosphoribosyltransferase [Tateyamaria sp.]MDG1680416.1 nicotinate-nucleotide--dimethylbenzimidazole phosphoribosyltransferase [Tateyamaria sp.]MDG2377912.1 nicotinate-nucleotide--dimethylbenzimidazole phosphoribosyltransferase [Tateyamaria sp.]
MTFNTLNEFRGLLKEMPMADPKIAAEAAVRNGQLTKPPGALGRLEELAEWYASWRGNARPILEAPQIIIFAGNHGVAARGVSAFPPEVTAQMVANFEHGGAAINQLAASFGARMDVVPLDLERPTADFTIGPAMTEGDCVEALQAGWAAVDQNTDLLVVGEMGIGNTTSASAIAARLFGGLPIDWTGRGTGIEESALFIKTQIVSEGLSRHSDAIDGLDVLMRLGGRELAGMAGAITRARSLRVPVILDGFICTAAAACLEYTEVGALDHCVAGHQSAESAHYRMLEALHKPALLQLGLRLGEGSGGALAIGVLKGAIACHSGMSTFAEAGVAAG